MVPLIIPIIKIKEEFYAEIHHPNKDIVDLNRAFFKISKQKLAEILQSKRKAFRMKATIQKSEKNTKYALPDSHVQADQGSDLVIIQLKAVKRLGLNVRPTSTFANHYFNMSDINRDFIKLKSWMIFSVKVSAIQ